MYGIETLIVWTEGQHVDLALSFQEADGCEHIWYVYMRVVREKLGVACTNMPFFSLSLGNGYKKNMKTVNNFHLPSVSVISRKKMTLSCTPSFTILYPPHQLPIRTQRIHHQLESLTNLTCYLHPSYRIYHKLRISYQMQRRYKKRIG